MKHIHLLSSDSDSNLLRLAYAEIYKAIAGLARRFDFELHDTTMEDMKIVGERVFAITRRGQTQVYATVTDLARM